MVDWAMSTLPAAATFNSGLVICRLFVSMMPFAMVKLPLRSLNAVLAPVPAHVGDLPLADRADHLRQVHALDGASLTAKFPAL